MLVLIRDVRETDDFDTIYELVNGTFQRFSGDKQIVDGRFGEGLKQTYSNPDSLNKGFIAVQNHQIIAFMGVYPSRITKNGFIDCGYQEGAEETLTELLNACIPVIQEQGGSKIYKYISSKFGQVRNKGITLWEKHGFTPDEYAQIPTILDLKDWNEPVEFDSSGIEPAVELNYEGIREFLMEDGEEAMAELFQKQYVPGANPDQVILTLRDHESNEIAGIAYYRVLLANKGTENEFLDGISFGLHIRPHFTLIPAEIRRFVQGCLFSMKQLELQHVVTYLTLKRFDVFSALVMEGFHNKGLENANSIRLYKNI